MAENTASTIDAGRSVLISGAGFAGLTAAYWMNRLGYQVTIVESGNGVKRGGTPVDIRDRTIDIAARMGILDAVRSKSLPARITEFTDFDGGVQARLEPEAADADGSVDGYEIPRDDLLDILFALVEDDVELVFGSSITDLTDIDGGVRATFRDGSAQDYSLVLGCDGNHSNVRRLRFGTDAEYSHFLHNYFTVSIVDASIIEPDTTVIRNAPGKTIMLNSYEDKTDVCFVFHSSEEIPYDYHDDAEQKRIVRAQFAGLGDDVDALLAAAHGADNFYFDKLSQTKMPRWTTDRVALVGDAGYCASPAAGMGGSLAIVGATALHDAIEQSGGDVAAAFAAYEQNLRPFVDEVQAAAVDFGLATYFPETEEAIRARNAQFSGE